MVNLEFDSREKGILLEALEHRSSLEKSDNIELLKLDKIKVKLLSPIGSLKPTDRSKIIGCLQETFLASNRDLYELSDIQLLFLTSELKERIETLDATLRVKNKLKRKSEKPDRLFETKVRKLQELLRAKKVYYSADQGGSIYKAGIIVSGKGVRFDLAQNSPIERLKIENLTGKIYENHGAPNEVLNLLNQYRAHSDLTKSQISFRKLLELIVATQEN